MPKPILLVKLNSNSPISELAGANKYFEERKEIAEDYHVLIMNGGKDIDGVDVSVLNVTDLDPIAFEEFKTKIQDELKNCKP